MILNFLHFLETYLIHKNGEVCICISMLDLHLSMQIFLHESILVVMVVVVGLVVYFPGAKVNFIFLICWLK